MLPKEIQAVLALLPEEYRKIVEPVFMVYEFRIEKLEAEAKHLSDQLAKNSRNSNKPPSSDTFNKPAPKSLRKKTERKPGGQKGHDGTTLKMVDCQDIQVTHRVEDWSL